MATPTVGVNSYITNADCDTYIEDAIHGTPWNDASEGDQDDALITAARFIDRQIWQGSKTAPSPGQPLEWPRTGLTTPGGDLVDSVTVPQFVIDANCELALALINDINLQDKPDQDQNLKRVGAGSAAVEFFKPENRGRFPTIVQELIGFYLEGFFESPVYSDADEESTLGDYSMNKGL